MEQNNQSSKVGIILAIAVIVIGIGAAVFVLMQKPETKESSNSNDSSPTTKTDTNSSDQKTESTTDTTGGTVITFTDDGFDKMQYTSRAGEAVTVKNASSMDLQFSSDDHPTHRNHPELNEDVLSPGESTTFTPSGTGTYGFHDHLHDQYTGALIVE